jgi:AAA domain
MKSSTSYSSLTSVSILCVGEPKSGKTRLMMSFPTPGIIDVDLNLNSAVRVANGKEFYFSQPSIDEKTSLEVPIEKRWPIVVEETKKMILDPNIKTICVDGLTILSDWLLAYCEAELVKGGINIQKEYMAKYQRYGIIMPQYISMLRSSGKLIFVTCHQLMDKEEGTGRVRYFLALPGQLKDRLGGFFNDVWAMSSTPAGASVKYEIRTKPTGFHVNLGTSLDLLPSIDITNKSLEETWGMLSAKLVGGGGGEGKK